MVSFWEYDDGQFKSEQEMLIYSSSYNCLEQQLQKNDIDDKQKEEVFKSILLNEFFVI